MSADPQLVARYKAELAACLASEVAAWEAKPRDEIVRLLAKGPFVYEVVFKGAEYNLVADLLEHTPEYLNILIDVQSGPERIDVIAAPRDPGSAGWTAEQMGMFSKNIIIEDPTAG